jgi:RHH-type rel operon transcriptional repressor/antitoxin RelB
MSLSIRLEPDIEQRLENLAEKTGRSKTFYAREAIIEHLEQLEDTYLALLRLEKPAKRWTLAELENDLDLDS